VSQVFTMRSMSARLTVGARGASAAGTAGRRNRLRLSATAVPSPAPNAGLPDGSHTDNATPSGSAEARFLRAPAVRLRAC
jgi:hypothetical protein